MWSCCARNSGSLLGAAAWHFFGDKDDVVRHTNWCAMVIVAMLLEKK